MAARCADNSGTDCVIVAAGDADSLDAGDGEGVGIAAIADWQRNTISKQEIFITRKSQNLPARSAVRRLRDEALLVGQRDRLFWSLHFLNQDLRSGKFACRISVTCEFLLVRS